MFVLSWGTTLFLVAAVACLAVAAVIYRARPDRAQNRLLALALFVDGLNWMMLVGRVAAEDAVTATAAYATQIPLLAAAAFAYLLFLGTLETPIARPLRSRVGILTVVLAAIGVLAIFFARRAWFFTGGLVPGPEPWRWDLQQSDAGLPLLLVGHGLILGFAFLVALHAWMRQIPGSAARSRALTYFAAFAVRDLVLLVDWVILLLHVRAGTTAVQTPWGRIEMLLIPASILAFCGLVAYGILRHQLFDIDLKIKWTIKKSTLVAVFVALFFVVSESAALFFGDRIGPYLGIVAAGLLLFAIAPLQRLADRVADTAMPHVKDTPGYRARRQESLYRAALEEALTGDGVTLKERRLLLRLQHEMGLAADAALRLEREVLGKREVT